MNCKKWKTLVVATGKAMKGNMFAGCFVDLSSKLLKWAQNSNH